LVLLDVLVRLPPFIFLDLLDRIIVMRLCFFVMRDLFILPPSDPCDDCDSIVEACDDSITELF
jgi:hypothetical protein